MADKKTGHPGIIEHGSAGHCALLGIDQADNAEAKAKLEQALVVPPIVSTKKPITPENYAPRTGRNPGTPIFDGWLRMGR